MVIKNGQRKALIALGTLSAIILIAITAGYWTVHADTKKDVKYVLKSTITNKVKIRGLEITDEYLHRGILRIEASQKELHIKVDKLLTK